jgi:hypothetical protein
MSPARKLSDVEFLSLMLALILRGEHKSITVSDRTRLERYLDPSATTPNKHFMATVALYIVTVLLPVPKMRPAREKRFVLIERCFAILSDLTAEEEHNGPTWREFRCPDPHQGMYELARGVLAWFGLSLPKHNSFRKLAERNVAMLAADLRTYDLVATHWGECHAMVGERCDLDPQREAMTAVYREIRQRQKTEKDLRHRGYNGKVRPLPSLCPFDNLNENSAIWYGPAWAWRLVLNRGGVEADDLFPMAGCLASAILDMEIWHYDYGAMVTLADPGEGEHHKYETKGSFAAKRSPDNDEDAATCVEIFYGKQPYGFTLRVIHTWEKPVNPINEALNPRLVAKIPAS